MTSARTEAGFTLIEIIAVVMLIAIVMAALVMNLGGGFGVQLRNSGRGLASELEYVGQRAIATSRAHRFVVNLDQQAFRIEELLPPPPAEDFSLPEHAELLDLSAPVASREFAPVPTRHGDWRYLDDPDVGIDEVRIGDDSVVDGEVGIGFSPDGGADPAELWLLDSAGYELRVRVVAFTGEIHVEDGKR